MSTVETIKGRVQTCMTEHDAAQSDGSLFCNIHLQKRRWRNVVEVCKPSEFQRGDLSDTRFDISDCGKGDRIHDPEAKEKTSVKQDDTGAYLTSIIRRALFFKVWGRPLRNERTERPSKTSSRGTVPSRGWPSDEPWS
jgi:hypothetical protein